MPRQGYVLIDFEHGGLADTEPPSPKPVAWDDATLENGVYTKASDMYELGKLKDHLPGVVLSANGVEFWDNLRNEDHQQRMTAQNALIHPWMTIKSA